MSMTDGAAFHQAEQVFAELRAVLEQAGQEKWRIDQLERGLFALLLKLGFELLEVFLSRAGDGDQGPTLEQQGRTLVRLEQRSRRYVSVFGEHRFQQYVYAVRKGQKIEEQPLDRQFGLPAGEHSYVLQDWLERLCVKESFAEAGASLEGLLGVRIPLATAERLNQHLAHEAEQFRLSQPPPEPESEAELVVYANDCKGVPMRRPLPERIRGQRRGKGEKANQKKMACVGAAYSVARFVRTADDILAEVMDQAQAAERPEPQNKRLWAEMTLASEDESLTGKTRVFIQQALDLAARDPTKQKPVVCLTDGEKALRREQQDWLPRAVGVLDIWHVTEYLWKAAYGFHAEGSAGARTFVRERLRGLLEGKVGYVIGHLRRLRNTPGLKARERKTLDTAITYFENNRAYMQYDEYLAAGYPIGSGVAEGACRHVVKDRMEQSGMRWSLAGAQAMLHLRAIYLNGDWDAYLEHHLEREQAALYGQTAA
jgi:hypothetical protein